MYYKLPIFLKYWSLLLETYNARIMPALFIWAYCCSQTLSSSHRENC